MKLSKNTGINKYAIKRQDNKHLPYRPIYSLGPVQLKTLKTYIKTHLKIGFIQPSKSLAGAFILFNKKPDGSFWLCVDYQGLNNFTIQNLYQLPLIKKALDWLHRGKQFAQLDLTSAYYQMRIKESDE